ncbi:nucleotidyltransferase family protein [Jiella endophytica]|nr:nucleotidyltransferase domain-containing protein [Jiella endophytica]
MSVVTISERKMREASRRSAAAARVAARLRDYARREGGRFVLFGSAARGTMDHKSDLDVLVDFPIAREHEAFAYLEEACRLEGLDLDALTFRTMSTDFLERNARDLQVLA